MSLVEQTELVSGTVCGHSFQFHSVSSVCDECESEITSAEQLNQNRRMMVAAQRMVIDAPSPIDLSRWRKKWKLTQAKAGTMTGLGPTAFSKYENSAVLPSGPTRAFLHLLISSDAATMDFLKIHEAKNAVVKLGRTVDSDNIELHLNYEVVSKFELAGKPCVALKNLSVGHAYGSITNYDEERSDDTTTAEA